MPVFCGETADFNRERLVLPGQPGSAWEPWTSDRLLPCRIDFGQPLRSLQNIVAPPWFRHVGCFLVSGGFSIGRCRLENDLRPARLEIRCWQGPYASNRFFRSK